MRPRKEIEADVEKAIKGESGDMEPLQRVLIETFLDIRELLQTFPHLHKEKE